jgi:hypothetical protein
MKKLALIALVALALPAPALAKGPSKARIVGPGVTTIRVSGAEGSSTSFWRLVEAAGWFEAAWGTSYLPQSPPEANLGPRYTITWSVPSSAELQQDVYPYAQPGPVTYMPLGQKIWGRPVKGGWYMGGARLRRALERVGMPALAPEPARPDASAPAPVSSSSGGLSAAEVAALGGCALILLGALALGVRAGRRPRHVVGRIRLRLQRGSAAVVLHFQRVTRAHPRLLAMKRGAEMMKSRSDGIR